MTVSYQELYDAAATYDDWEQFVEDYAGVATYDEELVDVVTMLAEVEAQDVWAYLYEVNEVQDAMARTNFYQEIEA